MTETTTIVLCWNDDMWDALPNTCKQKHYDDYKIATCVDADANETVPTALTTALKIDRECSFFAEDRTECSTILKTALENIANHAPQDSSLSIVTLATAGIWNSSSSLKNAEIVTEQVYEAAAFQLGGDKNTGVCVYTPAILSNDKEQKAEKATVSVSTSFHQTEEPPKRMCQVEYPLLLSSNMFPSDILVPAKTQSLTQLFCVTDNDYMISTEQAVDQYDETKDSCSKRLLAQAGIS